MEIIIGKPYLQDGKTSRLCSDISLLEKKITLWYEVDNQFGKYLCNERVDAFLVGLLPYALARSSKDDPLVIKCCSPVSEKLFYQINSHYVPTLSKSINRYNKVFIECSLDSTMLESGKAVGTGVTGGVDSTYTLIKSTEFHSKNFRVSHGAYFEFDPEGIFDSDTQNAQRDHSRHICELNNIEWVNVKSNICQEVYRMAHEAIITPMLVSYVLAMSKLFSTYYLSSSYSYDDFRIIADSSEHYDLLNVHALTTENTSLYVEGSEFTRFEKTKFIAEYDMPKVLLNVCRAPIVENGKLRSCNRCSKCTRTMIDLDLVNKFDQFSSIFDVTAYRQNLNYYLGYLYFKKDDFTLDTLERFKEYNRSIPISARFSGLVKWARNGFKRGNPLQHTYSP